MDTEKLLTRRPGLSEDSALTSAFMDEMSGKTGGHSTLSITRLLWDQRQFLFRVLWRGLLVCAVAVFLIPNRYESTTRIMPPEGQNAAGMAMLLSMVGGTGAAAGGSVPGAGLGGPVANALGVKASGDLFVGVLQSDRVEQRLVDRFDLRKVYHERLNVEARKVLTKKTTIDQDRRSGIIAITITDRDRKRAAAIARAYVEELNTTLAEVSTSVARRERIFLEERLKDVKQELDYAATAFSQFASKNTAIDIPQQSKAMVEAAARLQGELIAAQSELKGLEQIYTSNNIRVRSVWARINELQVELNKIASAGTNGESPSSMYPSIRQLPLLGVTYANLYRQTRIEEAIYEILTKEYEMSKIQEAKEIATVRVLDEPMVPERKAFPPRLLLVTLGTLLSLVFGACWIVAKQFWYCVPAHNPWKVFAVEVADSTRPMADTRLGSFLRYLRRASARFGRTNKDLSLNAVENDPLPERDGSSNGDQLNR